MELVDRETRIFKQWKNKTTFTCQTSGDRITLNHLKYVFNNITKNILVISHQGYDITKELLNP